MNALMVFVVVVILPTGQPQVRAELVEVCPETTFIITGYQQMKVAGKILDWEARCYDSGLKLVTGT